LTTPRVPFVDLARQYLALRDELIEAMDRVGRSGSYILGNEVQRCEEAVAAFCGTRYALGVANCTDALTLSLKAVGVGPGDEVITAPNSFVASAGAIAAAGAKPVFADVGDDYNIDVAQVAAAITPRTRAIMPVHLTGRPACMDELIALSETHGLTLIEDAAQAMGARYKGRRAGSIGRLGCFSLHPLKTPHIYGDGGLIVCNDKSLYDQLAMLRNHGLRNRNECEVWGQNSRLDAIHAAMLSVNLKHVDDWNARARAIADRYRQGLRKFVAVPSDRPDEEPTYHRFVIQTPDRDDLTRFLAEQGIETAINYPIPIHLQPVGRRLGYKEGDFPVAERQAKRILSLPLYPEMADGEVDIVIGAICEFFQTRQDYREQSA
jgi:dTDP-4-amino-4,6-dideoxygalactose transaminase